MSLGGRVLASLAPEISAALAFRRDLRGMDRAGRFDDPRIPLPRMLDQEVVSFDLFDTVVRRRVPLAAIHRRVSEFADDFLVGDDGPLPRGLTLHARGRLLQVVQAAGRTAGRDEVALERVFDAALRPHVAGAAQRERAVAALIAEEEAAEAACLVLDPRMIEVVETLRAAGRQVILVSDMYLGEASIRRILDALGAGRCFDHVFVSASTGVTKRGGGMFAHVDRVLGISGARRLHLGDDRQADYLAPLRAGWDALHFVDPGLEQGKRVLAAVDGHERKRLAAGRRRIGASYPMAEAEALAGAVHSAFARRIVAHAVAGRFHKVLFLGRDGTRFRHLAEALVAGEGGGARVEACPPLGDLALSRRAGAWMAYPGRGDAQWQGFLADQVGFLDRSPLSIRTIMRSFALSPRDLAALDEAGQQEVAGYLAGDDPATDLGFDRLLSRDDLLCALDEALCAKRDRVLAYLEEQGLFDLNRRLLLVDIGYSGTVLKSLSEVFWRREAAGLGGAARIDLRMLASNRFHRGNLGRLHPAITMHPAEIFRHRTVAERAAAVNFSWLEPFSADRRLGALVDFRRAAEGRMAPVHAPPGREGGAAGLDERLSAFAGRYDRAVTQSGLSRAEADRIFAEEMLRLATRPSPAQVAAMDRLGHQSGLGEVVMQELVQPMRPYRLLADILRCVERDRWMQGSLVASGLGWLLPIVNRIAAVEAE